jgi:hypothetical protein
MSGTLTIPIGISGWTNVRFRTTESLGRKPASESPKRRQARRQPVGTTGAWPGLPCGGLRAVLRGICKPRLPRLAQAYMLLSTRTSEIPGGI